MLRFYAEDFCYATSIIGQIYMDLQSKAPQQSSLGCYEVALSSLDARCRAVGLAMTSRQIERVHLTDLDGIAYTGPYRIQK